MYKKNECPKNTHLVSITDSRQSVCYDKNCSVLHGTVNGLLHIMFTFCIQSTCGLKRINKTLASFIKMYCWSSWSFLIRWKWKHSCELIFSLQAFHDLISIIYRCIRVWTMKNVVDFNLLISVENIYWSRKKELFLSTCVQWMETSYSTTTTTTLLAPLINLNLKNRQE